MDRSAYVDILDIDEYREAKLFLSETKQQGFIVIKDGDIKSVFNTGLDGKNVIPEVDEINQGICGVVWSGEPDVIANLLGGDNKITLEWNFMQLKDGIDFALFLVDITCKVHRFQSGVGTCGGPIDVLLLTKDYTKWVRHKVLNP